MKEENLIRVGLRQRAVFVPDAFAQGRRQSLHPHTAVFAANLAKLGFGMGEDLLEAINRAGNEYQQELLVLFREVMRVNNNWTPLVKNWLIPTGESVFDHFATFFANVFQSPGTRLQCGHIIPPGTFPLERYNGCPFCGTPFVFGEIEVMGQNKDLKVLNLWTEKHVDAFLKDLLTSKTALDATQIDSLKLLLAERPLPAVEIGMKETLMLVIDLLVQLFRDADAQPLFTSPTEILRYLWFKKTGFLQIVEPSTIIQRTAKNNKHIHRPLDTSKETKVLTKETLKLKYTRYECRRVAQWLNGLKMAPEKMAEIMHPKREMWVRFIRALRLADYAKKPGFERLGQLLDVFYNQTYEVWQGRVDALRKRNDKETLALLKERPGMFARSLFANMLWFGPELPLKAFSEIIDQVPARLVFTLNMYAENYFQPGQFRVVKPLGGNMKTIPTHAMLKNYKSGEIEAMKDAIVDLSLLAMKKRFAAQPNANKTMFIDPQLFKMPVAIGDRSDQVQDLPVALMGTRFPVKGAHVRVFMQWGVGLPAQHLDMDLSCHVAYDEKVEVCSFYSLAPLGCKHSGDIRSIPEKVGTAEYVELDLQALRKAGARYVTFTSNAYSNGALSPNMVIGWMNNEFPMHVSESTGVAYDPSCVQHQVRISQSLAKGLVFGVLEFATNEIIWLEMPFGGQTVASMDLKGVKTLLAKLDSKLSIGNLLKIKAEAQGLQVLAQGPADEEYTAAWAMNAAAVTKLLVD
jgi:hypothetical protein